MFRFNLPNLASVKKLVHRSDRTSPTVNIEAPKPVITRPDNPWQDDLEKLVTDTLKRKDVRLEHDQAVQSGLPIDQLLEENEKKEPVPGVEPTRRLSDPTVTDVKVWWGDALSPWSDHTRSGKRQTNPDARAHSRWFK